jgi:predicted permease
MMHLLADLRFALRSLRKVPTFTSVAVLSIAFGIAANTAVFTLVDQVVLRTLPVTRPTQLVQVDAQGTESYGGGMGDGTELSYAMYRDLRDHNAVFDGMFCRFTWVLQVSENGRSERINGELVSGTFFPVLGLTPAVGRLFTPQEDRSAGGHPVAVLGYEYWHSRFNGDPGIVGRSVTVNGHPFEVVGVVRAGFHGLDIGQPPQMYLPITMQPQMGPAWLQLDGRRFRWVQVFGRLRDGMTAERAQAGLLPLYRSLLQQEVSAAAFAAASADTRRQFLQGGLHVKEAARGHSGLRDSVREPLLILMAIAAGVLLIVCANVANLLIARGAARHRELALRLAVGASRAQIVRLLLVESLALAALGTALGLVFASWGAGVLLQYFVSPDNPIAVGAEPDLRIVIFTAGLAVATAVLAGCLPALRSTRVDVAPALRSAGGAVASEQPRLRKTLVVAQVALSFLLLIGAGLFVRSLKNLLDVDTGYRTSRLVSFSFDLARSGYDPARAHDFAMRFHRRVLQTPGVSAAGYAFIGLLEGGGWGMGFTIEGYKPSGGEDAGSMCNAVSPGFFKTMGVPLIAGREFDDRDDRVLPRPEGWPYRVAVVNETFAKRYFKGASPLGRRVGIGQDPGTATPIEIVGLVKDTRYTGVREDVRPQIFFPYLQGDIESVTAYVRATGDAGETMQAMRRAVADLDPSMPIYNVSTLDERIERSVVNERLIATLSGALSAMATLLAIVGLYGVMAYTVTRRTREIGIRMALGALGSQIALRVLREAGVLIAIGLVLGLGAAVSLGRFVESQLYGVKPADGWTIVLAAVALGTVAAMAALLPARRAAAVSPMTALRDE